MYLDNNIIQNKKTVKYVFVFLVLCAISITITSELIIIVHNNAHIWYIVLFPVIACSSDIILISYIKKIDSQIIIASIIFISPIIAILLTNELCLTYSLISGNFIEISPNTIEKLPVWIFLTLTESIYNIMHELIKLNFLILSITIIMTVLVGIYGILLYHISIIIQKNSELLNKYPWITFIFYLSSRAIFLPLNDLNWSYWLLWIFGALLLIVYEQKGHNNTRILDYWMLWGGVMFVSNSYDLMFMATIFNLIFGFNEYLIMIVLTVLMLYFMFIWYYCFIKLQKEIKKVIFKETLYIFVFFLLLSTQIHSYWQITWISVILLIYSTIFFKITLKSNFEKILWVSWLRYTSLLISILVVGSIF